MKNRWLVFVVVTALVAGGALVLGRLGNSHKLGAPGLKMVERSVRDVDGNIVNTNTVDLPASVLDYTMSPLPVQRIELSWLPKDTTYGKGRYTSKSVPGIQSAPFRIDVGVVLMGTDRTSIHKPEICLDSQGWKLDHPQPETLPIARPYTYDLPVMKLTGTMRGLDAEGKKVTWRCLYVYWFVSENRVTAKHSERMWWMAKDLLATGVLPRWAYISHFAVCLPGQEEETFQRIKEFIAASVPEYQRVTGTRLETAQITPGTKPN